MGDSPAPELGEECELDSDELRSEPSPSRDTLLKFKMAVHKVAKMRDKERLAGNATFKAELVRGKQP